MWSGRFLPAFLPLLSCLIWAQTQPCPAPPPLQAPTERNIFSPQQEMDLGDAIAEQFQREYHVVEDPQLNAYLQGVGDRLLRQLNTSAGLRIRFVLVDLPVANAFTLPGGRIYFTRKLVVTVHSEDELAAVLAHELGHALTRQPAVDMSTRFQQVLRVTQLGDRKDIFGKWHQLVETSRVKPPKSNPKRGEREQLIADQVALYALAGAGYSPQAFVDFWDRFAETGGKAGGWLSDLFGTTKPEQKRLREARRNLALIPASCMRAAASPSEAFLQWQTAVNNYAATGLGESLPGLVWKRTLHPPLQSDFTQVRFSPDGGYLLAQDDSTIYVLSREPLSWLFSIDAPDAAAAQFTPDSREVVFASESLRVERWDIARRRRTATQEVVVRADCAQSLLAPDGKTLACVALSFENGVECNIQLLEVASSAKLFEKKNFYTPTFFDIIAVYVSRLQKLPVRPLVSLAFSPDAHYFVGAHRYSAIALDMWKDAPISLSGHLRELTSHFFTFIGPDRLVGVNFDHPDRSEVVSFPDGNLVTKVSLGRQRIDPPAHGDYLILRPVKDYPVGVLDLKTNKPIMARKEPTLDIYDQVYANARIDGKLALSDLTTHQQLAAVALPAGRLGIIRAESLSSDLRWLAVSGRSRGAVWDLEMGDRVFHVRNFNGAWFDDHDVLFADFPHTERIEKVERMVGMLDPLHRQDLDGDKIEESATRQFGEYLVSTKSEKHSWPPHDTDLEVRAIKDRKLAWSTHFAHEQPALYGCPAADRLVYSWPASSKAARTEIENDPALKAQLATSKDQNFDHLFQVHELHSGKLLGQVLLVTGKGSFRFVGVVAAGNWLAISDNTNRVLVYALGEAQPRSRFFGHRPALSSNGMLSLENEPGQVALYDVLSGERRQELSFPTRVAVSAFCAEGKKLLVVTNTQTAYLIDVSPGMPQAAKQ